MNLFSNFITAYSQTKIFFYFFRYFSNMANETSFLESDSFMDLPLLRKVDRKLELHHLTTMFLVDKYGNTVGRDI